MQEAVRWAGSRRCLRSRPGSLAMCKKTADFTHYISCQMQVCGQALRFLTGLQPLIRRVTTDYIRSMCSHGSTQTFPSETRRSLPHEFRVLSRRVELPKAGALFHNRLVSKQQCTRCATCGACEDCDFGICFNLSRLRPYLTLWGRDVHTATF